MSIASKLETMRPLPASDSLTAEQVDRYQAEFKEHATRWAEILERNGERMKKGRHSRTWRNTDGDARERLA